MWPLKSHPKGDPAPHLLAILSGEIEQKMVAELASAQGWHLTLANTIDEGHASLNATVAIVVIDRDTTPVDWRCPVQDFSQGPARPCVILASAVVDHYLFEEVVKQGGFDVVSKPLQPDELRRTALLALKFREHRWREHANG